MAKEDLRITPELLEVCFTSLSNKTFMKKYRHMICFFQRLGFFTEGPVKYEEEEKTAKAIYGVLYGVRIKAISEHPVLLNCTGNTIFENEFLNQKSNDTYRPEFLSELFPVGLDPVGIMYLSSEENDLKDGQIIPQLIDNLPENDSYLHDPIVITKKGSLPLQASVYSEGEFKKISYSSIEQSDIYENLTVVRLRGTLDFLAQANEKDIISWVKHSIEKVSCPYGSFKLDKSDVYFLHSFAPGKWIFSI